MTFLRDFARRPEFSALAGTLFVFVFFSIAGAPKFLTFSGTATWLNVAAELGIISLPVALVMIAGHLDLSVGSILAAGGLSYAVISGYYGLPGWVGVVAGLVLGALIGLINGLIVVRTKLPSFIVTLGTMFALQGIILGVVRLTTGTVLVSIHVDPVIKTIFGTLMFGQYETSIIFWAALAIIISVILYRTKYGNWIFAVGGDPVSAKAAGVPVEKTTVWLYVGSGFGAALVGVIQAALYGSAQSSAGQSYVFNSIIAVVVGGVLLTGGYGSPIGVILGTMTFAIVYQGINYTGWNSDWSSLFLGALLLIAVLTNNTLRRLALSGGKLKKGQALPREKVAATRAENTPAEEITEDANV